VVAVVVVVVVVVVVGKAGLFRCALISFVWPVTGMQEA
jgi:hypothetical protein